MSRVAAVVGLLLLAGCSGPTGQDADEAGLAQAVDEPAPVPVADPTVHWAFFNATADALDGRVAFVTNGLQPPTAAGVFLALAPNVTFLVVEVRWDDPQDDVSLVASARDPACQGFPPPLNEGCLNHYLRSYVDGEADGYWEVAGPPLQTDQLRLQLGPADLVSWLPSDWEFFGAVRHAAVDVHIILAVTVFQGQAVPEGYSAFA